jgi:uncharacterized protein DUF4124
MRITLAASCLALAFSAAAETIYKYRGPDGRTLYSNRLIPGAKLIESYEHAASAPAPHRDPSKYEAEAESRIKERVAALDKAWSEVQDSGKALAAAEASLAAGAAPGEGEARGLGTPADTTPPQAGGPLPAVPPAVGGRMSAGRGGGVSPEYQERVKALEAAVKTARTRNEAAWRRYNELR